jgi:NhaP-type Na+/H+ or K+/H+ antiporter
MAFGGAIYGLGKASLAGLTVDMTLVQALLFSSVISAVDPVAVMAVFEELRVPAHLGHLVFGESLLNDGVALVVYATVQELAKLGDVEASPSLYVYACLSIVTVALGGFIIGLICGLMSALVCKLTSKTTEIFEVAIVLLFAYFAYLSAAILSWSGIISIIGCGFAQVQI